MGQAIQPLIRVPARPRDLSSVVPPLRAGADTVSSGSRMDVLRKRARRIHPVPPRRHAAVDETVYSVQVEAPALA